MGDVVVLGAGPIGLASAMLLAREGHQVTVLEKDAQAPPTSPHEAWEQWERGGVAQFRLAHYMQARFRHLLDEELPAVRDEILALGGVRHSVLDGYLYALGDRTKRPGDEQYETITARRPVLESAFARVAEDTPGVKVVRGVNVDGVVAGGNGVAHVAGVHTREGEEIKADLVVDAMGRRSKFVDWMKAIGAREPYEEAFDAGFAYYSRTYHYPDEKVPEARGPVLQFLSTVSALTLPADNATCVVAVVASSGDKPLKTLRHNEVYERVVRSMPTLAHWIDGEPISDVLPMAGVADRYRRFVLDDQPCVTGLVAIGDAWACTNPSAGRGVTTGLKGAIALRDVAREHFDDPKALALELDRVLEERCAPWYRLQVVQDRDRHTAVQAAIEGRASAGPDIDNPVMQMVAAFRKAATVDPDVARAFVEVVSCLAFPADVIGRPGMMDKILMAASQAGEGPPPGPSREELLKLVS